MPVVEAVFVMAGPLGAQTPHSKRVEAAMLAAVQKAQAEGLTDPDEIRARMMAARDAVE
jgi:hypothetical protein